MLVADKIMADLNVIWTTRGYECCDAWAVIQTERANAELRLPGWETMLPPNNVDDGYIHHPEKHYHLGLTLHRFVLHKNMALYLMTRKVEFRKTNGRYIRRVSITLRL